MQTTQRLKKALQKAKRDFNKGLRYYDEKYQTYTPGSYAENILEQVSDLVGGYGVEAYRPGENNSMNPKYLYVNSGDSYALTLIFNRNSKKFTLSDIGSIIEREEL